MADWMGASEGCLLAFIMKIAKCAEEFFHFLYKL